MLTASDYYDGMTEQTDAVIKKLQTYIALALKQGDIAYQEKPGELVIKIRIRKEKKDGSKDKQ